jgi:phosphoribosylaminoimidazolecarboxamide formyltransferase/IMP cyclohydrolase
MKRQAFISVYEKARLVEQVKRLVAMDFDIVASGGTAKLLTESGISVIPTTKFVNSYARFLLEKNGVVITPEIENNLAGAVLDHQVATASRELLGGLLGKVKHLDEMSRLSMSWVHLVINDFYPLEKTIVTPDATPEQIRDNIDVGGPHMVHAAAKGSFEGRIIIADPNDREWVIKKMEESPDRDLDQATKDDLAAKADAIVSKYCMVAATWRSHGKYVGFFGVLQFLCKYGENAWQKFAGLFSMGTNDPLAIDRFRRVAGDDPSYNIICDVDRLLQTLTHIAAAFDKNRHRVPKIGICVKHGNACGADTGDSTRDVVEISMKGDLAAVFGGSVMTNFHIGIEEAEKLSVQKLDAVIAPSIDPEAIRRLERFHGKCRFLVNPALTSLDQNSLDMARRFRYVRGGFLMQDNYTYVIDLKDQEMVRHGQASPQNENSLLLAWAIGSTSNSNTITLVRDGYLIGNGVGQQDRVGSARLAIARAERPGHSVKGSVAYSDSFFPFPDGPQALVDAGVTTILTSSGSRKDNETIRVCVDNGVVLYMLPDAKCRGFYGH